MFKTSFSDIYKHCLCTRCVTADAKRAGQSAQTLMHSQNHDWWVGKKCLKHIHFHQRDLFKNAVRVQGFGCGKKNWRKIRKKKQPCWESITYSIQSTGPASLFNCQGLWSQPLHSRSPLSRCQNKHHANHKTLNHFAANASLVQFLMLSSRTWLLLSSLNFNFSKTPCNVFLPDGTPFLLDVTLLYREGKG